MAPGKYRRFACGIWAGLPDASANDCGYTHTSGAATVACQVPGKGLDMGSFSLWHWLIVLAVVVLVFGAGKLPRAMGDIAKGVKAFKKGLSEDDTVKTPPTEARPSDSTTGGVH
jgi:sec-independent protein translocase protein TatA